ncbi:MAG: hypothetical protein H7832_02640 [Magnetococcus sp. DMHC-6]
MSELLHATDPLGTYIKTGPRSVLMQEIRHYARQHGEAPFALPVVHIILLTSTGLIRMVQRGNKPENPYLWDKAVGGHVVCEERSLPLTAFHTNAKKEMAEELNIHQVHIAKDPWEYHQKLYTHDINTQQQALIRMIDYDPWQGAICRVHQGEPWLKRHQVVVYVGVYDGPFHFADGEAVAEKSISRQHLMAEINESPWQYADGARVFMTKYYHLLR